MVTKENGNAIKFLIMFLFLLGILFVVVPPLQQAMFIYLFIGIISLIVYSRAEAQGELIGISYRGFWRSTVWAVLLAGVFYFGIKITPFSFGIPILPNTIADQLRFFVVVVVAPAIESLFVQGALFGYVRTVIPGKKDLWTAIIIQAVFFAILHTSAYVIGFYNYPDLLSGFSAVSKNIGAFLSAFLFALLSGWFVTLNGIRNLWFVIIFHSLLNLIIYTTLTVGFI